MMEENALNRQAITLRIPMSSNFAYRSAMFAQDGAYTYLRKPLRPKYQEFLELYK